MATAMVALGSAAISSQQQITAGRIKNFESRVEADQIEAAASSREADRKEDLARAIASQSAGAGASGISLQGSPLTVLEADIEAEERATGRDLFQARLGKQAARTRGRTAERTARNRATVSLLKTAATETRTGS